MLIISTNLSRHMSRPKYTPRYKYGIYSVLVTSKRKARHVYGPSTQRGCMLYMERVRKALKGGDLC